MRINKLNPQEMNDQKATKANEARMSNDGWMRLDWLVWMSAAGMNCSSNEWEWNNQERKIAALINSLNQLISEIVVDWWINAAAMTSVNLNQQIPLLHSIYWFTRLPSFWIMVPDESLHLYAIW